MARCGENLKSRTRGVRLSAWCLLFGVWSVSVRCEGKLDGLVRDLADPNCAVREEAYGRLMAIVTDDPSLELSGLPAEHPDPEVVRQLEGLREAARYERWRRAAFEAAASDPELSQAFRCILAAPVPQNLMRLHEGLRPGAAHPFDRKAVSLFIGEYLADRDPAMRKAVLDVMDAAKEVHPADMASLLADPDREVRLAAIHVISRCCGAEAAPAMCALISDPDTHVCVRAVQALNKWSHSFTTSELMALLSDKRHDVRGIAIQAVPDEIPAEIIPTLCELSRGLDAGVRGAALKKLGAHLARSDVGEREILATLEKSLLDSSAVIRGLACSAAGISGRVELRSFLVRALDDPNLSVAIPALGALGEWACEEKELVPVVAARLSHEDFRVNGIAAQALGRIVGKKWRRMDPDTLEEARAWWEAHKNDPCFRGSDREKAGQ